MDYFISPTKGRLDLDQVFTDLMAYVHESPESDYRLIVGTDSQVASDTCFVTAVVIHRVGRGARYYYCREHEHSVKGLKQRIFYEASKSLELASHLAHKLSENGYGDLNIEIHLDLGENGRTKELIRDIVGMITGTGFEARIKPHSYGASKVADKYTR
jgi:predicted RNase H-related nuclease YkuK (DUF458 family)